MAADGRVLEGIRLLTAEPSTFLRKLQRGVGDLSQTKKGALDKAVDSSFESQQVPFLRELVELPSFSRSPYDVEQVAIRIDKAVKELGWKVATHSDPTGMYADHRVYTPPDLPDTTPALALCGHIDTVFPRSMGFLDFSRDTNDDGTPGDTIRGPGVLDMKNGVTLIYYALDAVRRVYPNEWKHLPVRWVSNTDEEFTSISSKAVFNALAPHLQAALVLECGRDGDKVVVARKGLARFRITAKGRAAHSGNDHEHGINAIHALALLVPKLESLTDYKKQLTVNVGTIEGGTSANTVPAHCMVEVDARFVTHQDGLQLVKDVEALATSTGMPGKLGEVELGVESLGFLLPLVPNPSSRTLLGAYAGCLDGLPLACGESPRQGGCSDANLLSAAGVPCIDGLGAFGKGFHRPSEWSSLASLNSRTKALARFLAALLESTRPDGKL